MIHNVNMTPTLVPLFRSQAQYRLIGELYTSPGLALSVGELAARLDVPHPTISREVARLTKAGLLQTQSQGKRTVVSAATTTALYADLRNLMTKVYGVVPALSEAFAGLAEELIVFGSWAARWHGEPGPPPRDLDVLVVGHAPATLIWGAAARLSRDIHTEVNVVVRTPQEWANETSGFATQVKHKPHLVIEVSDAEAGVDSADVADEGRWG